MPLDAHAAYYAFNFKSSAHPLLIGMESAQYFALLSHIALNFHDNSPSWKGKCKQRASGNLIFNIFAHVTDVWALGMAGVSLLTSHIIPKTKHDGGRYLLSHAFLCSLHFHCTIYFLAAANWVPPWWQEVSSAFDIKELAPLASILLTHRATNKQHEVYNSCKYLLIFHNAFLSYIMQRFVN